MALIATDLKFFQSELEGSSGGAISTLEIPQDEMCFMFPDVTRGQAKYGAVQYKKIFVLSLNMLDVLSNSRLWLLMQPSAGIKVAIGLGSANDTDGEVIQYSSPLSKSSGVIAGDIGPGVIIPVWIRRVIPSSTPVFERGFFQLAVSGQIS